MTHFPDPRVRGWFGLAVVSALALCVCDAGLGGEQLADAPAEQAGSASPSAAPADSSSSGGPLSGGSLSSADPAVSTPGGASWGPGLTDRELALGRWFSELTFRQDRTAQPWPEWHSEGRQLGVTSLRYQLAFAGYGCAAMAAQTPAYRDLVARQLRDLCERMIDLRVWDYVPVYWKYDDDPPDPCLYENVMYTGHLTQLMCLYELLSGDRRYSQAGWDFTWHDGRRVHYDLRKAIDRLHVQAQQNTGGGICCEPGLVFATCNSHSAASFVLFDTLYGTRYAEINAKWFDWLTDKFRLRQREGGEFLSVMYHQRMGLFVPLGDAGADAWTLGWGYPWFPTVELARNGWEHLVARAPWKQADAQTAFVGNSLLMNCGGGGFQAIRNSFIPLIGVQVEGRDSTVAQRVLGWFENAYGRQADLDGDGHCESYYYSDDGLRIATTGNIAAALATDRDSLRQLFRTPRTSLFTEPTVARVDYPNVYVRTAEYRVPTLRFTVLKGTPGFRGTTQIVCAHVSPGARVLRNGLPFTACSQTGSTLVIHTDVDREHVFEVTAGEAS